MTLPAWAVAATLFICPVPNGACQQHQGGGVDRHDCGKSIHAFLPQYGGDVRMTAKCLKR